VSECALDRPIVRDLLASAWRSWPRIGCC